MAEGTIKPVAQNRKAYHDYHILKTVEAGLALTGTEVKSLRAGRVNLRDSFARGEGGELWLHNTHISRYEPGSIYNPPPTRPRKLLLHREQIDDLVSQATQKGLTIVPLKLYFKDGLAKVELGLAKGKKLFDKREALRERDIERQSRQELKDIKQGRKN